MASWATRSADSAAVRAAVQLTQDQPISLAKAAVANPDKLPGIGGILQCAILVDPRLLHFQDSTPNERRHQPVFLTGLVPCSCIQLLLRDGCSWCRRCWCFQLRCGHSRLLLQLPALIGHFESICAGCQGVFRRPEVAATPE